MYKAWFISILTGLGNLHSRLCAVVVEIQDVGMKQHRDIWPLVTTTTTSDLGGLHTLLPRHMPHDSSRRTFPRSDSNSQVLPQRMKLTTLPNKIQQFIYGYALQDPDALIALIYTSQTVRINTLTVVWLWGNPELWKLAEETWDYWCATKAERWPDEWRGRWS